MKRHLRSVCVKAARVSPRPAFTVLAAIALVASGIAGASPTRAAGPQGSNLYLWGTDTKVQGDAYAGLLRHPGWVRMSLHTSGLPPGSADTVWWVVFNHPTACITGTVRGTAARCGLLDLTNPASQPSVLYATGRIVRADGRAYFGAYLVPGDTSGCVPGVFPCNNGLTNLMGADIDLVVRTHGAPIPGMVAAQLGSFNGGCPPNTCANLQFAVFESAS